ncbi:pyruvate dehydrogenase complex dihydrolipoamide acetyltransferase [Xanthobacteraceae bacterium Astr-EGSB]|uniref:pyruvate dehydrogenase complex dihydrolipoamide acetyltransferase n=1 Tax=Astrobacterium formosum TaxID=3069710 RepID=UPI0027B7EA5D|nr:pyruvate dehydrogenase complex dihydrolipoamide acetyltransferase [Xanthobacteraceae bacterium Astr-EGSB]
MPINILMPALSPTMEKGNLAKWRKKEGEAIAPGDVIAEIETDKATMDYEAVDAGTLAKIVVPEGTADVPVNQLIAVIAAEGEDVKAAASAAGQGGAPAKAEAKPEAKPAAPATVVEAPKATPSAPAPSPQPSPQLGEGAAGPSAGPAAVHAGTRIFASPLARRLAREAGIDIARVLGTGPHSRVVARDVDAAKSGKVPLKATAGAPAAAAPGPVAAMSDDKVRALFEEGSYEVVPHDNMRKIIAQRLVQAKQTIPHFYLTVTCTIDKLLAAREDINAAAPKGEDGKPAYKLSVNDFVIKAMAQALVRVPDANVTWTEGGMLKHKHADIGVAVAIPGGLITPVIRQAETKTLTQISAEMKDYAARARARKLKPHEYQGGSTAISNLGMYGIEEFSAVINPPHATILAVGAGAEMAVVKNGAIEIATQMKITLSTDHRAVDGALGAELISAIKAMIENPVMLVV